MSFQEKINQELLSDLQELQKNYEAILTLYENRTKESARTEKELRENEANLKAILENSLESIWSVDTNYNIQYINEVFATAFLNIFGVHLKKGLNILESLPHEIRPIWKERYDRAFNNEHFVFTDKIDVENGSVFIEVAMNPVIISGKVAGASVFGKDISERVSSAQALLESETRFKALHNASFGGIAIHDHGIILECNQGLSTMTGYSEEELIGMNGLLLISEKSRDFVISNVNDWYEKPYEVIGLKKNGKEYPLRIEARNVPYKGKIVRTTEFRDITAEKQAEAAYWESQLNFKALFEKGPIGVAYHRMVYDKTGKPVDYYFLDANQSFQKITGVNPVGKLVTEAFPGIEKDPFDWIGIYGEVAKTGKEIRIQQYLQMSNKWYDCVAYQYKPDHFVAAFLDITEQKLTEETLRSSEERMKILFNYAPEAYYLNDLNGILVDGNLAAEKLMGYNKGELIGKSIFKINMLPKKYYLRASKIITQSISGKVTGPTEFELIRKDGTKVLVEIFTHPVKIKGQTLVLGIARDISERRKAEKEMQLASQNWSRTFHAMGSGIALLDDNQLILQTNNAFQNFVNQKEVNLQGNPYFTVIYGKQIAAESNPFKRMLKSKVCEKTETKIYDRTFEVLVDPIIGSSGKITGAVLILNDITQKKRDEDIQQILHEITGTSMFDKSLDDLLFFVRNQLSKVLDTTNFFVAIYQPETETLKKVIFEDEKDDFIEWDANKSLSGQIIKLRKPLLLKSDEETHFAAENNIELLGSPAACWLGVPIMNGDKAVGVIVVQSYTDENAYDNTAIRLLVLIAHELSIIIERKKMIHDLVAAKERAEESDRLKSAFLANMSHEIRTPMNGILGFAELLKEPKLSGKEQREFLEIIEKSGERMLNIINDLINISKIESGQMDVHFSETDINEQLLFLYNFFKLEASQKKINLVVNYLHSEKLKFVYTDKEKVYAILTNFIKNAIKFTDSGIIEFGCVVDENKLIFNVKDSGIGIPLNKQKSIFERFVQAGNGKPNMHEGVGLGLAISKAYVEMLEGEIWMESELGIGSSFFFAIPLKLKKEAKPVTIEEPVEIVENKDKVITILIAEDDEISLIYLSQLLKTDYINILVAKTGAEAVEICRNNQDIELILMDINMPVFNGDIASKFIREFRPDLPIIAQTAFALEEDREKYSDSFDDYITKPIKADELKLKMRKFLKLYNN